MLLSIWGRQVGELKDNDDTNTINEAENKGMLRSLNKAKAQDKGLKNLRKQKTQEG